MLAEMIYLQHQVTQTACNSACISSSTAGDIGSLCDMIDCRLPNNLLTDAGIQRLRDVAKATHQLWLAWWATVTVIINNNSHLILYSAMYPDIHLNYNIIKMYNH